MKIKNIIAAIAILFIAVSADAQSRHQFSINAGGGLSTFDYKPAAGSKKTGFGGIFGVDYTYFFSEKWGIGTGFGAALFNGKYDLPNFDEHYSSNDGEENFEFNYNIKNYSEKHQAVLLNIPLMLRFESGKFYAGIGAKAGIWIKASYKSSMSELRAFGYYPQYSLTLNDPAFMGFGTFRDISNDGDLKLKTAFFASAELGIKWGKVYTGIYFDYGLTDIKKTTAQAQKLVQYELPEPSAYKPNSIFSASTGGNNFAEKVTPLAAGIKIGFVIGGSKPKAKSIKEDKPVETPSAFDAQAEAERQRLADEEARRKAEAEQREAEERRKADETSRLEAQRQSDEARKAAEQRQYDDDMQILRKPVDGYSISSARLTDFIKTELDRKAEILKRYPDINIQLEGHACDIGSNAVNMQLGQRRADTAKDYLVGKGIAANRIITASKGKTEPIAPNTNEENRRKNRRVKIIIE
jgi:outer membrane protein OmpA-like peptidoglycan-associated protein